MFSAYNTRTEVNGGTHLGFLTAENFSETMCFKKLKQKKKICGSREHVGPEVKQM